MMSRRERTRRHGCAGTLRGVCPLLLLLLLLSASHAFLSSRSGVTLPQRRREDGSLYTVHSNAQDREQRYRVRMPATVCNAVPTAWRPLSKEAQLQDYRRSKQGGASGVAVAVGQVPRPVVVTSGKDDGASPTALREFCSRETKIRPEAGMDGGRGMLAQCLREDNVQWCPGDRHEIAVAAGELRGVKQLGGKSPKCMVVNKWSCPQIDAPLNQETGQVHLPARAKKLAELGLPEQALPNRDLVRHAFKRCAIVGNGPSLAGAQSGRFINQYDAVFRFNSITNTDPVEGRMTEVGSKTTFRMFNRITSLELAEGLYKLKPKPKETWLFWHANSAAVLPAIKRRYPTVTLAMLSPAEVNWQLEAYFQLRRDARQLGFGPFSCPSNLNTGLHAILLAQHLCQQVGTFGISHTVGASLGRFSADNHTISKFHAWDFDALLIRMLHFAGRLDVCNG